jgi:hypothetical protein
MACVFVTVTGLGAAGCRRSPAPTPEATPSTTEAEPAEGSAEAPPEEAPSPAPSVDALTQLRWQALAKGEADPNASPSEAAPDAPGPRPARPDEKAPMNSERAGLRDYWQERINEARGPYENARATFRQDCPALPPEQKRTPEDKSYCDDLEKAERQAKDRYETAKQGAARAGFSLQ